MNPQQQAAFQQNWLNAFQSGAQQPTAQLQETQAATGAEGASAAASSEAAQATAQKIAQTKILGQVKNTFDSSVNKDGYVDPNTYNNAKKQAAAIGVDSGTFDNTFQSSYTDPTNAIEYNTGAGAQYRQKRAQIANNIVPNINTLLQQYAGLSQKGPGSNLFTNIPGVSNFLDINRPEAQYEASRQAYAPSLKSLTAGVDSTGLRLNIPEIQNMANLLPSINDQPDTVKSKLSQLDSAVKNLTGGKQGIDPTTLKAVEDSYNQKSSSPQASTPSKSGSLTGNKTLDTLLTGGKNDILGDIKGLETATAPGLDPALNPQNNIDSMKALVSSYASLVGVGSQNGQLNWSPQNTLNQVLNHPVNSALSVLPFLGGGEGGTPTESEAPTAESTTPTIKDPNALQKILSPGKIKQNAGNLIDQIVSSASKAGATISGDNTVQQLQDWADSTGKPGNPGQGAKIDAILEDAQKAYAGKQLDPQTVHNIYNEVDSGYNQKGVQKDAIQSRADIALRKILRGQLDQAAPGFDKLTNIIGQGYKAEQSTGAQIIKNLPKNAVKTGMNVAGLGILRDLIGF